MNCSENKPAFGCVTLVLDRKDCDVLRHSLGRYDSYLQAHVDLLGGNAFIQSELTRVRALLEELPKNEDKYGNK